jgi:hypothetical protein
VREQRDGVGGGNSMDPRRTEGGFRGDEDNLTLFVCQPKAALHIIGIAKISTKSKNFRVLYVHIHRTI